MMLHTYPGQNDPNTKRVTVLFCFVKKGYISWKIFLKNLKKINDAYFEGLKAFAKSRSLTKSYTYFTFTFTFMHLADAFIQSDLQCIQVTVFKFYQLFL